MKTKNEKCEKYMDEFLMLDKNAPIPLRITLHLLKCSSCRNQVRLLSIAERVAASPLKIELPLSDEKIKAAVMDTNPSWSPKIKPVTMSRWVICGILMIMFMLVFAIFTHGLRNERLLIAFYLVFAIAVCSYCALFIGTNMDFFIKKIKTIKSSRNLIF